MTIGLAELNFDTLEDTLAIKKAERLVDALAPRLMELEVETFGNTLAEALLNTLAYQIIEEEVETFSDTVAEMQVLEKLKSQHMWSFRHLARHWPRSKAEADKVAVVNIETLGDQLDDAEA